jgi:amino acid transporter
VGDLSELRPSLYIGFAVASIGGPLALLTIFPGVAGDGVESAAIVVVLSLALFAAPVAIWLSFSRTVVTSGGLTAFVDAAAGRRLALVQGWIWIFAYFLYLPYTITAVVYDVLTPVFPGISPYRSALELVLPVAIVLLVLGPVRPLLAALGVLAVVQLVLLVVMSIIELRHVGHVQIAGASAHDTARAAAGTALLFVCASLPLYLGAEVRGGSRTVRRGLALAIGVTGVAFFLAAFPLAAVPDALLDSQVPGAAIAQAYSGRGLAVVVGLVTALSILALVVAEYLALGRLIHWLHGFQLRSVLALIAIPFVLGDAISLIDPDRFYDDLIKPSLGALFVSQLIVFAVFPLYRRGAAALGLAAVSAALAVWGLYQLVAGAASS